MNSKTNRGSLFRKPWFWIIVVLLLAVSVSNINEKRTNNIENSQESNTKLNSESTDTKAEDLENIIETIDTSDYLKINADLLFEYGEYMAGENVVTVITVADTSTTMLKAKTENNTSLFFSIYCEFENSKNINSVSKGDVVTVAGTVDTKALIGETVTLLNCYIIGNGDIEQELIDGADEQRTMVQQIKNVHDAKIAADLAQERSDFISQCEYLSYNDVERNPDSYKGTYVKISGSVVQVSEGWFNSVTLRIDCSGDVWYVTYVRNDGESRILEGDWITCYGICDGVKSYTSVLGSQITIPSLDMKYYE